MSTKRSLEVAARTWLSDLGMRCAATMKLEEAEARAREYATGLIDLPEQVFCDASREAAARQFDHFPSYASIRKFLLAWRAESQRAIAPPLPGEDDPSLDHRDRQFLAGFATARADGFQHLTGKGDARQRTMVVLDTIRQTAPRAFAYLTRTDTEAASIALQRRWVNDPASHGWDDEVAVRAMIGRIIAPMPDGSVWAGQAAALDAVRTALERHAPHLGHLVPSATASQSERAPTVPARTAAPLSQEQLVASYQAQQRERPSPPLWTFGANR